VIDWLNSFSFEAVARLVHPLVVLAVLAAINGAGGYWGLGGAPDYEESYDDGASSAGFVVLMLILDTGAVLLCNWWWWCWGTEWSDGMGLLTIFHSIALLGALLGGYLLYPTAKGD
jgi:hypothetical protein